MNQVDDSTGKKEVPIKSLPKVLQQHYSIDLIRDASVTTEEK